MAVVHCISTKYGFAMRVKDKFHPINLEQIQKYACNVTIKPGRI